ncbi:nuclear body protein SP140 [Octodon degus]|uniref:Nuclear body protein SP140 n=1 Tax=Octodon degus TaxID=10160 RepID=A0A6P6EZV3_OCTDE|nr:nuclear body protein SP140 [Octodon degus]
MASRDGDLSFRAVTEDEVSQEVMFKLFRTNKVEIASAITKPFPFLMSLRDRALISEQMYEDFQDACTNLVPVRRVMYDVLTELQKTFHPSLLKVLFSKTNLQAYPDLKKISRSFSYVSHEHVALLQTNGADAGEIPRVPPGGGQGIYDPQTPQITHRGKRTLNLPPDEGEGNSKTDFQCPLENSNDCVEMSEAEEPKEASSSFSRHGLASCDPEAPQVTNGDEAEETASQAPCQEEEEGNGPCLRRLSGEEPGTPTKSLSGNRGRDCLDCEVPTPNSEQEPPESDELQDYHMNEEESEELNSSPLPPNSQGAEQSGRETEKCFCVMCCPKLPEDWAAITNSSQACDLSGTSDTGTCSTSGKPKRKRRKKRGHNWSRMKKKRPQNIHQKFFPGTRRGKSKIHLTQNDRDAPKKVQLKGRRGGRCKFPSNRVVRKKGWLKGINRVNTKLIRRVGKKGFRYLKKTDVDFSIPELPVTCGYARGTLIKKLFKQGIWKKSIQSEDGRWFTPREFEIEGNYAPSKNWKLSLRCHGWKLKDLLEDIYQNCQIKEQRAMFLGKELFPGKVSTIPDLVVPVVLEDASSGMLLPLRNSEECEVCRDGGTLFCCDSCSRAFHKDCHVARVEANRDPWSCIFCRVEPFQVQQRYQESEILERPMQAEEQLKCEFLLLKVYCCSESSFFAKIPYYYYNKEPSEVSKEHMWLDKIKTKLTKKDYTQVEGFVQDMRLIFENHRHFHKDPKFGQMGLRLEAEFEKNFKEIFAIQGTNESS